MALAQTLLIVLGFYFAFGLFFALAFVLKGVRVIDPAAHSATFGFRVLIFPGAVALWPILAKRWRKPLPPQERSPHRRVV